MNYDLLKTQLRVDEGVRRRRYLDTAKLPRWTIGVGHNITDDPAYPYRVTDEPPREGSGEREPIRVRVLPLPRSVPEGSLQEIDLAGYWW